MSFNNKFLNMRWNGKTYVIQTSCSESDSNHESDEDGAQPEIDKQKGIRL